MDTKCCSKCGQIKPLYDFWLDRSNVDQRRCRCISCSKGNSENAQYHAQYYQNHQEEFKVYRANNRRLHPDRTAENRKRKLSTYRLTQDQYDQKLATQNFVCAVCGNTNGKNQLAIDHDHTCCSGNRSCGKCIRSLLCNRCNTVLGFVQDSQDLLLALTQYLGDWR